MRLLGLSKIISLIIFFSLTLASYLIAEEKTVDIWKKKEKKSQTSINKNEEKLQDKTINIQLTKPQSQIQEETPENFKETKLFGIFDPSKNDFELSMWEKTEGKEIKNILKRINKLQLSKTAEELFINTFYSYSYLPKNMTEKELLDLKISWMIENNKNELIEKFLESNNEFYNKEKLVQYLVDSNISKANIVESCKKVNFISKEIKDSYLEKFKIYCLVFNNKKNQASLLYDILKEQDQSDAFFDDKINFLLGVTNQTNQKIKDDNLLNFYLSSVTVDNFNYQPSKKTKPTIWEYLNSANLIQVENYDDKERISELELAANENRLEKKKIFGIYKKISFDLNTLINADKIYQTYNGVDSRALIYQKFLLSDNIENQLDLLFVLKDLFKKDKLSNVYTQFLSDQLKSFNQNDIPKRYKKVVEKNIFDDDKAKLIKIKYDDKILHRSKVTKYFLDDSPSKEKYQKDFNNIYKKIKRNKKYFFSAKDLALVESLIHDGFTVPKDLKYKEIGKKYNVPQNLVKLAEADQPGFLSLKIVEIIGEDEAHNLDPETIYFITNLLNQLGLTKIRNDILISALPQRS